MARKPKNGTAADFQLTGIIELDKALAKMLRENGRTSINRAGRAAAKFFMRDVVLPESQAILGRHSPSGNPSAGDRVGISLVEELKLMPLKRAKGNVGYTVGFADRVFMGDTFYAGFLEFGYTDRGGNERTGDSFIRKPLYDNKSAFVAEAVTQLRAVVRHANNTVAT